MIPNEKLQEAILEGLPPDQDPPSAPGPGLLDELVEVAARIAAERKREIYCHPDDEEQLREALAAVVPARHGSEITIRSDGYAIKGQFIVVRPADLQLPRSRML